MTGRRRLFAGVLAVLAVGLAPAGAAGESELVLPTSSLPGLHATPASIRIARLDLGAGLPRPQLADVQRAVVEASAAVGRRLRVRSAAFVFASPATARRVMAAWHRRHGGGPQALGNGGFLVANGATAIVAWRTGARIGVIVVIGRRGTPGIAGLARAYAGLAANRLLNPIPITAWDRVLAQIRPDGSMSEATALAAFSLAYTRLPGVRVPAGTSSVILDGTPAAEWIARYYGRLSRSQQRVVQRVLGIGIGAGRAHAASYGDPNFVPAADYQAIVDGLIPDYEQRLGHHLGLTVVAGRTTVIPTKKKNTTVLADAQAQNADGSTNKGAPVTCRIRMSEAGQAKLPPDRTFVLAHELFHCFQFDLRGTGVWTPLPLWIGEGTADWAAATIKPGSWDQLKDLVELDKYIQAPARPLFERMYDAIGFWGHAQDVSGNLWSVLPDIITNGGSRHAFNAAGGNTDAFLTSWASSFVRVPGGIGGLPWFLQDPVSPPDLNHLYTPIGDIAGDGTVASPPYTTSAYALKAIPGEPLVHVSVQGIGRLSDVSNYTDLKDAWFCIDPGGCRCPPDTTGELPPTRPLALPTFFALTGDPNDPLGSFAVVTSAPLSRFCEPQPAPQGGGSGTSNGDPYLTTFDGAAYGFQTAGEFTLVKSTIDNLEIQARQVPYPRALYPTLRRSLAMNTAFAMRVGATVIEVDKGSPLVLYVNHGHRRVGRAAVIRLPGGGRVDYGAQSTVIHWGDGTTARVLSIGDEGVNIVVRPSRRRAGLLTGLLGNDDGNGANDFVGRGGRRYDAATIESVGLLVRSRAQVHTLLTGFGRSWRITQRQSLFVYPRGRNTRSYLVRGFPRAIVSLASIPSGRRQTAARICRRAGVTNPTLLVGCQIDYGATGDHRLATATGAVQHAAGLPGSQEPSGPVISRVPWTRLSSTVEHQAGTVVPSIAPAAGQVVAAYRRASDQAIEAATFTAASVGVTALTRTFAFTGWQSTTDPVLFAGPGGAVNMIVGGIRNGPTNDPLNGTDIAARHPDGTFAPPTLLTASVTGVVSSATLAADGTTPLWTPRTPLALDVFSGSVLHDLTSQSPGVPVWPKLARDRSGRVWLAWYVNLGSGAGRYMMQLDPATGAPAGPALLAPHSNDGPQFVDPITIACAQSCRLLYQNPDTADESLTSWAPGEAQGMTVSPAIVAGHPQAPQSVAAAYTADGRLWVAWNDAESRHTFATLGDARGAGGTLTELPFPAGGFTEAEATAATTIGSRLVLATDWQDGKGAAAVWATVVNPG